MSRELHIGPGMPEMDTWTLATLRSINARMAYRRFTRRDLKLALIKEFGACFWCDRAVRDYRRNFRRGERVPRDLASVDHLVSRFHRRRGDVVLKVLSCSPCNTKRGKAEDRLYGPRPATGP